MRFGGKYFWFSISVNNGRNDLSEKEIYEGKLDRVLDKLDLNESKQKYYEQFKHLDDMDLFDLHLSHAYFLSLDVIEKQLLRKKNNLESKLKKINNKV